jgi:hypothetical protein
MRRSGSDSPLPRSRCRCGRLPICVMRGLARRLCRVLGCWPGLSLAGCGEQGVLPTSNCPVGGGEPLRIAPD